MFSFLSYLRNGYIWVMPLVLLAFLLITSRKNLIKGIIGIANTIMMIVLSITVINWGADLFFAWYGQNSYEQWAFTDTAVPHSTFYISLLFDFVFALCFLFKKLRLSAWFSIIVWLCSLDTVVLFTANYADKLFYRGNLPTSWSTYYKDSNSKWIETGLSIFLFAAAVVLVYWCKQLWLSRKKLPVQK